MRLMRVASPGVRSLIIRDPEYHFARDWRIEPTSLLGGIATLLETRFQKPPVLFYNVGHHYSVCGSSEEACSLMC